MDETASIPPARIKLQKLSRIRRIAKLILDGPRSAMFPDDPNGLKLWVEPVVRMTSHFTAPKKSESLIVFNVPNCLERNDTDPVLIRHSNWASGEDKTSIFDGAEKDWPTISTSFKLLPFNQLSLIDELLRRVDESLPTLLFQAEGLDIVDRSSKNESLPNDDLIFTNTVHNELCRTTRFCYVEIRWSPIDANLSKLDQAWLALFETLIGFVNTSDPVASVEILEKYDLDPRIYGEFLFPVLAAPSPS